MRNIALIISIVLVGSVLALGVACAKPAPAPAPAPAKPAPAPAPASKPTPLQQIIEGAKKEGTLSTSLTSGYDAPKVVEVLRKAIKDKYGVDLDIRVQATSGMAGMLAKAVMETRTGVEPTYDIISIGTDNVPDGTRDGIFETIDWRSLLEPGTSPKVAYDHPQLKAGVVFYSSLVGLMYNPEKVPAAEVPKKIGDLADPKWKGRLGVHDYPAYWARYAFMLGKERILSELRAILKNKPILDRFPPLNTRYLAGEIDLDFTTDTYVKDNLARGKPAAWRNIELVEVRDMQLVVMKGTKRPNAAKLFSIFLASPEGAKFTIEVGKKGHHLYPGNHTYDAVEAGKKEGIPVHTLDSYPGMLDFILSPAYGALQKEIQLIIDTAGK